MNIHESSLGKSSLTTQLCSFLSFFLLLVQDQLCLQLLLADSKKMNVDGKTLQAQRNPSLVASGIPQLDAREIPKHPRWHPLGILSLLRESPMVKLTK